MFVYPGGPPAQVVTSHGQSVFARTSIIAGSLCVGFQSALS